MKALELDPDHADAWSHLGVAGGGMVGSRFFNQTDCFVQVLKFKQNSSRAWSHLGTAGGGKVGSTWYTWKDCYEKSLELDPNYADTWANLGAAGGGKVSNHPYSETECYAKALELSPRSSSTWYNLGAAGGGKVKGTTFSACDCYVQSLELDPKFAPAWSNLGRCGGRKVKGSCGDRTCSPKDCYVTALELDPKYADAWSALGDAGGGTVGSTHYSWKDCKAKARAWTLHQEAETWYNFGLLGSGSIGSSQCNAPEQCFEKATDLLDQELDAVVSRLPVGSADDLRDIAISLLGESKTAFKDQMTAVFRECHPSTPSCLDAQDEQDQLATDLTQQMPHVPPETIRAVLKGALIQMQSTRSKLTELNDDTLLKAICEAERSWKRQHYTLTARKLASQVGRFLPCMCSLCCSLSLSRSLSLSLSLSLALALSTRSLSVSLCSRPSLEGLCTRELARCTGHTVGRSLQLIAGFNRTPLGRWPDTRRPAGEPVVGWASLFLNLCDLEGLSVGATQAFLAFAALSALTMAFAVSLVWRRGLEISLSEHVSTVSRISL